MTAETDNVQPDNGPGDLSRVLDRVRPRLLGRLELPDSEANAGAAALALLRAMIVHAEAINTLSHTPFAEASNANLRVMFEAWTQLLYFLKLPDREAGAFRYTAFALLEFRDHLLASGADPEDLAVVEREISLLRSRSGTLMEEVERLRSGKTDGDRRYWCGLGPTKIVDEVAADLGDDGQLRRFYKFSSWDSHHIMAPALDVRRLDSGDEIRLEFGPRQSSEEAAQFCCHLASRMLAKAWTTAVEVLGLKVSLDEDGEPGRRE